MWSGPAQAGGGAQVFPPDSKPYGLTYPQWQAAYQKWIEEIPASENPLVDPDSPRNCEVSGKVVYLGANGTGQGCSVPEGQAIVLAAGFWECSTAEGLGDTYPELRHCAKFHFHHDLSHRDVHLTLRIDGDRVAHSRDWTFLSPGQVIDFPDDNIWGAPGGPTKSITKGFLYVLPPLSDGEHTIVIRVEFPDGTHFPVPYNVTVE
jgi:hypothetical protein